ncbi:MAG: acyl carrier protein [Casimicrobiaceae bacterium]
MPDELPIQHPAIAPGPTVLGFLRQIIARDFDVDPQLLHGQARLEDFEIDSLGLIEIMFAVEDQFGITVPPEPPDARTPIHTLDDLVRYLDRLVSEQRGTTDTIAATDADPPG